MIQSHPMYAQVVINRKTPGNLDTFLYECPKEGNFEIGQTVRVPLRKQKIAGVIVGLSDKKPSFNVKEILEKMSEEILLQPWQLELAHFIADYYLCPLSRTIPLFLPKKIWNPPSRSRAPSPSLPLPPFGSNKKSVQLLEGEKDKEVRDEGNQTSKKEIQLTSKQQKVLEMIEENPGGKFLLHGVTGSGKTEIYLRCAKKMAEEGKQSLILVPEIALTPQLIAYFQNHFQKPVSVIHSKLTEKERRETWLKIFRKESSIIIGSRSALFSPFQNLGLLVMDEEHEWAYKQDQTPRYHARTVAEKISELTGATLILGSATPSVETYFKSGEKIGAILELSERAQPTPMPKTTVIDMREEMRNKNFGVFSELLKQKIAETLARKKQIILFINRRGVAPATLCRDCGYVVRCSSCHIAMVTHKTKTGSYTMVCHHCGQFQTPPSVCPECQSVRIRWIGVGTQQVEEEIKKMFGLARVLRADRDTMVKKEDYDALYRKLQNREIDILVGTQIIAKGLDIPHVHLIGVVLADTSLHFPDFRAAEKTFQLLTQVSGRAGREKEQGEVVIQTYSPEHYAVGAASDHDFHRFYKEEIRIRKEALYPPFSKIIQLSFSHTDEKKCREEAERVEEKLKTSAARENLDIKINACPASIPRKGNKYHWHVILQGKEPAGILKNFLSELQVGWKIDVDPVI